MRFERNVIVYHVNGKEYKEQLQMIIENRNEVVTDIDLIITNGIGTEFNVEQYNQDSHI